MNPRARRGAVLALAALATGLTAGVFADWAQTIMPGLGATDDRTFLVAFRALDRAILEPPFLVAFGGALLACGAAALLHRHPGDRPVRPWVVAALGLLVAAFVITAVVHEPLNAVVRDVADPGRLADPAGVRGAVEETRWAAWHLVRTVATVVALGCLLRALVLHGRITAVATGPALR